MILFLVFRIILGPFLFQLVVTSEILQNEFINLYYLNVFIVGTFVILNMYWFVLLIKIALPKKEKKLKNTPIEISKEKYDTSPKQIRRKNI